MKQTHRFARLLACAGLIAGTLSLWGCGSASTYDPITPTRIVAFGDALVDVGQTGRTVTVKNSSGTDVTFPYRFTINTGTTTNTSSTFIESLAGYFGFGSVIYPTTTTALPSTGAYSYGEFGALVSGAAGTKDARGCIKDTASTTTTTAYCAYNLQAQIDLFLAKATPTSNDLFVISIGTGDIMATGIQGTTTTPYVGFDTLQTLLGGPLTATQINARMQTAAEALAVQIKRLTDAGAKYVLVIGPPNVGRSPWAAETGNATLLQNLSYNTGSGVTSMGSEGLARIQATFGNKTNNSVLFVEISGLVNTLTDGTNTTFANRSSAICASTTSITVGGVTTTISSTTTDTAQSNGTGTGRLTAALCTVNTLGSNNPGTFVYADGVNFTPTMQGQFFSQALSRMRLAAWVN